MAVANHKIKGAHAGLSGHVSYTSQQHNFWGMVDRRNNRIEVMRKHGTLPTKARRNPMRAEKTPRKDDHGHFDFSIPTGRKELKDFHRWDYPETDFGLMGKFNTQKDKYDIFKGTQKEYIEKMKAKVAYEKEMEEKLKREAEEIAERANMPSARDQLTARDETPRTSRTARDELELDMHKEKIANFRLLGQVEPRVLEKYRAERAKKFLMTYHEEESNPLDPPRMRKIKHKQAFLPAGTAPMGEDVSSPLDPDFEPIGTNGGIKIRGGFSPKATKPGGIPKGKQAALNHLVGQLDTAEKDIAKAEARLQALRTKR